MSAKGTKGFHSRDGIIKLFRKEESVLEEESAK